MADMDGALDWVDEPHRFKVLHEGRLLTAYNKGNPQYGDFFKAFPNIEPVHTLSGLPVTASGAANFNHHKSVFLGLGRLTGTTSTTTAIPRSRRTGRSRPGTSSRSTRRCAAKGMPSSWRRATSGSRRWMCLRRCANSSRRPRARTGASRNGCARNTAPCASPWRALLHHRRRLRVRGHRRRAPLRAGRAQLPRRPRRRRDRRGGRRAGRRLGRLLGLPRRARAGHRGHEPPGQPPDPVSGACLRVLRAEPLLCHRSPITDCRRASGSCSATGSSCTTATPRRSTCGGCSTSSGASPGL